MQCNISLESVLQRLEPRITQLLQEPFRPFSSDNWTQIVIQAGDILVDFVRRRQSSVYSEEVVDGVCVCKSEYTLIFDLWVNKTCNMKTCKVFHIDVVDLSGVSRRG